MSHTSLLPTTPQTPSPSPAPLRRSAAPSPSPALARSFSSARISSPPPVPSSPSRGPSSLFGPALPSSRSPSRSRSGSRPASQTRTTTATRIPIHWFHDPGPSVQHATVGEAYAWLLDQPLPPPSTAAVPHPLSPEEERAIRARVRREEQEAERNGVGLIDLGRTLKVKMERGEISAARVEREYGNIGRRALRRYERGMRQAARAPDAAESESEDEREERERKERARRAPSLTPTEPDEEDAPVTQAEATAAAQRMGAKVRDFAFEGQTRDGDGDEVMTDAEETQEIVSPRTPTVLSPRARGLKRLNDRSDEEEMVESPKRRRMTPMAGASATPTFSQPMPALLRSPSPTPAQPRKGLGRSKTFAIIR